MKKRIAVPSIAPGGLDAQCSEHFGHCEVFTLVDVEGSDIKEVSTLENGKHQHGGCLRPVETLLMKGVQAVVAGGMGLNPLRGFRAAGIDVFVGKGTTVKEMVDSYLSGEARLMTDNHVCGCCGH